MPRMRLEAAIQCAIVAELAVRLPISAILFHVPNQDDSGSLLYGMAKIRAGMLPGFPDLGLIYQGRLFLMEVKEPAKGELNDNQRALHPRLRASGCPVEVVFGVDDAVDFVASCGIPLSVGKRI